MDSLRVGGSTGDGELSSVPVCKFSQVKLGGPQASCGLVVSPRTYISRYMIAKTSIECQKSKGIPGTRGNARSRELLDEERPMGIL